MLILESVVHQTIWGGDRIGKWIQKDVKKLGHLYLVNGHSTLSNPIMNGEFKGQTLHDIFPYKKKEWKMEQFLEFPLTIALVDALESLSIQVHPNDEVAECLEKKRIGKKESWLFLEPPVNGWIYAGCECTSENELLEAIENERMEEITTRFSIKKNDYVTVEAGMLHAMTTGSLVYEIEYGSDYTYRFFDYNRLDNGKKRKLHVEKAIQAIDLRCVPKVIPFEDNKWNSGDIYEICRYKKISYYKNSGTEIECVSILSGKGECEKVNIISGISMIILPGEELVNVDIEDMIVARMCK